MKTNIHVSSTERQLSAAVPINYQPSTSPYTNKPSIENIIMKALFKNIPIFLFTVSLIFLVACSSEPKHKSAGEYLDDAVITTRVKAAIIADDTLKASEINVETYKGIVQLSGFVSSSADQSKAEKVTKSVGGVKSIKNDIRIK